MLSWRLGAARANYAPDAVFVIVTQSEKMKKCGWGEMVVP
jgi:hypothetical protein